MFDFLNYVKDFNITYWTSGKNVSPGWINITCPFCDDSSNHLGFNLKKNYFFCWKCQWHSIYDTIKLLTPEENTNYIIKKYNIRYQVLNIKEIKIKNEKIKVPGTNLLKYHKDYLKKRFFDADFLQQKYKIKGTSHLGAYCFRIIVPIYVEGKIISYQGRDVSGLSDLRYKACKKEKEVIHHKDTLYNIDNCNEDYIIVTEGIFDVWRIGNNCCCTFGKNYTKKQLLILKEYKYVFVFFDNDFPGQSSAKLLCDALNGVGVECYNIVEKTDAADMTQEQANNLLNEIYDLM